jgi:hypothetical protein
MVKLIITPDEITAKACEFYPYDTEKTCKDKFTRDLRNGVIDLMRMTFAQGVKYAVVKLNKKQ